MFERKKLPKIIFLTGVDGAGKTLYANMLLKELRKNGVDAVHVWSRYNNFFSKPLLALTRLTGHNYKEYHVGVEFGYHDFGRSKIISYLFITLQIIDLNIATYLKIKRRIKNNRVLICDRGPYDTMVDVMLDTDTRIIEGFFYKLFLMALPNKHTVCYLFRPLEKIYEKRPEMKFDRTLKKKDKLYQMCQRNFGWRRFDNLNSPGKIFSRIIDFINRNDPSCA